MLFLKPSQIYYSQDSISNTFDKKCRHNCTMIGETLDAICEGRCTIYDIPTIRVCQHNGKYVTADNRRLWVFRHLERLGKCTQIQVIETYGLPDAKMTSINGGMNVRVRGTPGGYWYRKSSSSYSNRVSQTDNFISNSSYRPSSSASYGYSPEPSYPRSSNQTNYGYESSRYGSNTQSSYRSYSAPTPPPRQNDSWCTIL